MKHVHGRRASSNPSFERPARKPRRPLTSRRQTRTNTLRPFSGYRIAQTAWFVVSVYYGLMIGETSKEGLARSILSDDMSPSRLWIILPTLLFYFFSAAESYLWLNPRENEEVTSEEAAFRGLHLLIFVAAILAQSFLMRASNDPKLKGGAEFILWMRSFACVLLIFSFYNVVWMIRRKWGNSSRCPPWRSLAIYVVHYLWFGGVFLCAAQIIESRGPSNLHVPGVAAAALFFCYLFTYLMIWWKGWHRKALSIEHLNLY